MKSKLFNKNFVLLWLGQAVSQIGDGAGYVALIWWVQSATGSAVALGVLAMSKSSVRVLLGPFTGVIADRLNRKWLIFWADLLRGFIYLALAYSAHYGYLKFYQVVIAGVLTTALHSLFTPAIISSIPSIVPKEELSRANSFRQMTGTISNILSYAVGGILIITIGIPALLFLDGISYIISAISEAFIDIPSVNKQGRTFNKQVFVSDLKAGLAYIKDHSLLIKVIKISISANLFIAPLMVLLPKFVNDNLQAGSNIYGILLSSIMAGTLLATVLIAFFKLKDKFYTLSRVSVLITGIALMALALPVKAWYLHGFLLFMMGFFVGIVNIYLDTILQKIIQPNMLGKVFGLMGSLTGGLQPLSQGVFSVIADTINVGYVFAICGAPMIYNGITFYKIEELREDIALAQ